MQHSFKYHSRPSGFTLIELLVVIAILGILAAAISPALNASKEIASAAKNTSAVQQFTEATLSLAADNQGKLPSPVYPGGIKLPTGVAEADAFPPHYNLGGSGLWLDGVVYGRMYIDGGAGVSDSVDEIGSHLKGTVFESTQSVKKTPSETDWHKHSYAMNASLQYDRVFDQITGASSDPSLTEKSLANFNYSTGGMLFIENADSNVVTDADREEIIATGEKRWRGGKVIVAFLDGHVERLRESDIPSGDITTDRDSSIFWRGATPE